MAGTRSARTNGPSDGTDTAATPGGFAFIAVLESTPVRNAIGPRAATAAIQSGILSLMTDTIIPHIEACRCCRGPLLAERRNRGYTLYHARSGGPIARLRPTGQDDRFEVLYWSLWKERWISGGPLGRAVPPIDRVLEFIAPEDIFWTAT